jgi:hypothetical protein
MALASFELRVPGTWFISFPSSPTPPAARGASEPVRLPVVLSAIVRRGSGSGAAESGVNA